MNYNFKNDSDFESDCSTSDDNYFSDEDQINHELKWLRFMIINEQEFERMNTESKTA